MAKKNSKKRVIVVHTHERGEGSSIVAVYPDTPVGRVKAKQKQIACTSDNGVDVASVDEIEVERT